MTFNIGGMPPSAMMMMAEGMLTGEGYSWTSLSPTALDVLKHGERVATVDFRPAADNSTLPALVVQPFTLDKFDFIAALYVGIATIMEPEKMLPSGDAT
jgi:hypothetical protein